MFMTGYKNLFKMNILSKTLEKSSYMVMNRRRGPMKKVLESDGTGGR
jgi:hypothetical protein